MRFAGQSRRNSTIRHRENGETVELVIGNSLWRNYTEEGVRNIEANVAMNLRLGYANRINPTVESVLESVYQTGENTKARSDDLLDLFRCEREREREKEGDAPVQVIRAKQEN